MSGDRAGESARFLALLDQEIDRRRFVGLAERGDPREALTHRPRPAHSGVDSGKRSPRALPGRCRPLRLRCSG
jgi:hypothetical protein